jgi:hypothetical protein
MQAPSAPAASRHGRGLPRLAWQLIRASPVLSVVAGLLLFILIGWAA